MISLKLLAVIFVFMAFANMNLVRTNDDDDDNGDEDYDESLEEKRKALMIVRELANSFNSERDFDEAAAYIAYGNHNDDENDYILQDKRSLLKNLIKRKLDAEEVREIDAKTIARRKKAYKNYEDACKIHEKFKVRSCPKLEECFAKNKIAFVPILNSTDQPPTTLPPTTKLAGTTKPNSLSKPGGIKTIPKAVGREFIMRELATRFLEEEIENELEDANSDVARRFLLKSANKELIEETKEIRDKGFKKYEEYCEKRLFRIGSKRNCPQLNQKLCL